MNGPTLSWFRTSYGQELYDWPRLPMYRRDAACEWYAQFTLHLRTKHKGTELWNGVCLSNRRSSINILMWIWWNAPNLDSIVRYCHWRGDIVKAWDRCACLIPWLDHHADEFWLHWFDFKWVRAICCWWETKYNMLLYWMLSQGERICMALIVMWICMFQRDQLIVMWICMSQSRCLNEYCAISWTMYLSF